MRHFSSNHFGGDGAVEPICGTDIMVPGSSGAFPADGCLGGAKASGVKLIGPLSCVTRKIPAYPYSQVKNSKKEVARAAGQAS